MARGTLWGFLAGAAMALALGWGIALLPATPTYALWQLTRAIDRGDVAEASDLIDIPAMTLHALNDLQQSPAEPEPPVDLGRLARAVLSGERIRTVFDDPDHPLKMTLADFLSAWWGMRREGPRATLTLHANGRPIDLILEQRGGLEWKVVGVRPIGALLRIEPQGAPT